jgi:hypothetical protein
MFVPCDAVSAELDKLSSPCLFRLWTDEKKVRYPAFDEQFFNAGLGQFSGPRRRAVTPSTVTGIVTVDTLRQFPNVCSVCEDGRNLRFAIETRPPMNDVLIAAGFCLMVLAPCIVAVFSFRNDESKLADTPPALLTSVVAIPLHDRRRPGVRC